MTVEQTSRHILCILWVGWISLTVLKKSNFTSSVNIIWSVTAFTYDSYKIAKLLRTAFVLKSFAS